MSVVDCAKAPAAKKPIPIQILFIRALLDV
jgi:hypothetical protein